jgi:hypothetical protein
MTKLRRFIAWGEHMLRRHEQGDHEAHTWAAFFNLTAFSIVVAVGVIVAWWWI